MKKKYFLAISALLFIVVIPAHAANYILDIKGQHAFIHFKVKHLGYSWLLGQFRSFDGSFTYDSKNPNAATIKVTIDTSSIDTNHALRDKHLRAKDVVNVSAYPVASFVSSSYQENADGTGVLKGTFSFNGVTKPITIQTQKIGEGKDPWGGYRVGFSGTTQFKLKDFNVVKQLGPASTEVFLDLHIEGIRQ